MQRIATWDLIGVAGMPVDLSGKQFFTMGEVADVAEVARQTVWRWKKAGKIPAGRRYRGREVLYTLEEMGAIYGYAHRIEPEEDGTAFRNQLSLFPQLRAETAHQTL